MSEHRIKGPNAHAEGGSTNPPGYAQPLNASRCAALHNFLVQRGFEDVEPRTWWEEHGSTMEDVPSKLHPNVVQFLKRAWSSWNHGHNRNCFWNLQLTLPHDLFLNGVNEAYRGMRTLDMDDDEDDSEDSSMENEGPLSEEEEEEEEAGLDLEHHRFITLYTSTQPSLSASPPIGLVFDQKRQCAIFIATKDDIPLAISGQLGSWSPLEMPLEIWHGMLDREKVLTHDNKFWQIRPFAPLDLEDTVRAWNDLVRTIEQRLPKHEREREDQKTSTLPLLSQDVLADNCPEFFREFFTRAKRPNFEFIAPGLAVPSASVLLANMTTATTNRSPLLFLTVPSHQEATRLQQQQVVVSSSSTNEKLFPRAKNIPDNAAFAPGLYLSSTSTEIPIYADSFRLVLPFPIGAKSYARPGFGTWVSESGDLVVADPEEKGNRARYAELYQSGYDEVGGGAEGHDSQMFRVLENWKARVEQGSAGWGVGENGVCGKTLGIRVFEKADEALWWGAYELPGSYAAAGM